MSPIFLLLLFPLIWPFVAKRLWNNEITWSEMGLNIAIVAVLTTGVYQLGKYGATQDTEVWNGSIVSKDRIHDSYERSYDCNCYETCSGSGNNRTCTTTCDTCYEDHYTVTWSAVSTAGNIRFEHLDETHRSVYDTPDPQVYKNCKIGEPASLEHTYTNYVQAVPHSLFNDDSTVAEQYAGKIPAYPRVHNFYHITRTLNVGSSVPTQVISEFNEQVNEALITLGPSKQANIIVIFTDIMDPSYRYAVENAWLGGKKNDIVVFIGTTDGKTVGWVDIMTWALNSGNEMFHVKMRDGAKVLPIDATQMSTFISSTVEQYYDRPHMSDYQYLEQEIKPATWVMNIAIFISIVGSILLSVLFRVVDFFN